VRLDCGCRWSRFPKNSRGRSWKYKLCIGTNLCAIRRCLSTRGCGQDYCISGQTDLADMRLRSLTDISILRPEFNKYSGAAVRCDVHEKLISFSRRMKAFQGGKPAARLCGSSRRRADDVISFFFFVRRCSIFG